MAKKPKLENLDELFSKNKDFELTDAQYEERTEAPLPKGKSYLLHSSALAQAAKARGYQMEVTDIVGRKIRFTKKK